jgi:hypothetical protein
MEEDSKVIHATAAVEFLVDGSRECLVAGQRVTYINGLFVQKHTFESPIFEMNGSQITPIPEPQWTVSLTSQRAL